MARQTRTRRRRPQLRTLIAMATTASALSLNDLQPIADGQLVITCQLAYRTPILGCTNADFQQGSQCSSTCVTGLDITTTTVETLCNNVNVSRNTVLGQAILGNLEGFVCNGQFTVSATATLTTPPQQTTTTPAATTTSRTIKTFTTIPSSTVVPPISTSTRKTTTTQPTTEASTTLIPITSSTSSKTMSSTETTSTTQAQTQTQPTSTLVISTSQTLTTTTSASATTTSTSSGSSSSGERGGGSPFDPQSSGSTLLGMSWAQNAMIATAVGLTAWWT